MSNSNPYSSPKAEADEISADDLSLHKMEFNQLKKLYNRSINISLLALYRSPELFGEDRIKHKDIIHQ